LFNRGILIAIDYLNIVLIKLYLSLYIPNLTYLVLNSLILFFIFYIFIEIDFISFLILSLILIFILSLLLI